jgi:hypothetical protein
MPGSLAEFDSGQRETCEIQRYLAPLLLLYFAPPSAFCSGAGRSEGRHGENLSLKMWGKIILKITAQVVTHASLQRQLLLKVFTT